MDAVPRQATKTNKISFNTSGRLNLIKRSKKVIAENTKTEKYS